MAKHNLRLIADNTTSDLSSDPPLPQMRGAENIKSHPSLYVIERAPKIEPGKFVRIIHEVTAKWAAVAYETGNGFAD